ncbi:MAG: sigma-70 family RNA polymerase sigma factor [Kofleriaceae bacterium]
MPAKVSPTEWTESQLLTRVLNRDGQAWNELVRRYRPLVYRCIGKVTGRAGGRSGADVDEIYAEVMLQLVRDDMHKLRIYDPARGTKLSSWIGMLSVNAAYDHLRASGRRPMLLADDGPLEPRGADERSPLLALLEKERWSHFNELLGDFTEKDRTFVDLYFQRGLPPDDVAAQMQISLKTVYSKKHKIRAHLLRCLERLRGDSPIADLALAAA